MSKFNELNLEDQKLLQNRDRLHRTAVLKLREAVFAAVVVQLDDKVTGGLLDKLDAGETITSDSGLNGTSNITKEDNKINLSLMADLITTWNTDLLRDSHVRYVGSVNIDVQK